ncbi:MAG: hypothetical protein EP297_06745 [Gammaproteobacteria bacterium]|nr:MAG: hypothetical protein EP297_06745 [Gammaproteobacteria bacterium]
MERQKFKFSETDRVVLKNCLKKKHQKMEIEKHGRKFRFARGAPPEVIDVTITKKSVDEFLDITEGWVGFLFYQERPFLKLHKRCDEIENLLNMLIPKLTLDYLDIIEFSIEGRVVHGKNVPVFLKPFREANKKLLDAASENIEDWKWETAINELIAQLAFSYKKVFKEKPPVGVKGKLYEYLKNVVSLIQEDFEDEMRFSNKRLEVVLRKYFKPKYKKES